MLASFYLGVSGKGLMKDFIRSFIAGIRIIILSVLLFIPIIMWRILSIGFSLMKYRIIKMIFWDIKYWHIPDNVFSAYRIISYIIITLICIALYFPLVRLFVRNAKEILKEQKVIK